jgi:hypothetical protein
MEEFDIESLVNDIDFEKNSIEYINGEIVLTKREIELLDSLEINYKGYTSMSSLISAIEEVSEDDPEIEEILKDMSDRNYYLNTNK